MRNKKCTEEMKERDEMNVGSTIEVQHTNAIVI